jgi:hypothetical protein
MNRLFSKCLLSLPFFFPQIYSGLLTKVIPRFEWFNNVKLDKLVAKYPALASGCAAGTLVKTPDSYKQIQDIKVGDAVVGTNRHSWQTNGRVSKIRKIKVSAVAVIVVAEQVVVCGLSQRFFCCNIYKWVRPNQVDLSGNPRKKTKLLMPGVLMNSLCSKNQQRHFPREVSQLGADVELYDITVEGLENFCVTEKEIVAHNFVPAAVVLTFAFSAEGIAFTGVSLSLGALGLGIVYFCCNKVTQLPRYNPHMTAVRELLPLWQLPESLQLSLGLVPSCQGIQEVVFGKDCSAEQSKRPAGSKE